MFCKGGRAGQGVSRSGLTRTCGRESVGIVFRGAPEWATPGNPAGPKRLWPRHLVINGKYISNYPYRRSGAELRNRWPTTAPSIRQARITSGWTKAVLRPYQDQDDWKRHRSEPGDGGREERVVTGGASGAAQDGRLDPATGKLRPPIRSCTQLSSRPPGAAIGGSVEDAQPSSAGGTDWYLRLLRSLLPRRGEQPTTSSSGGPATSRVRTWTRPARR